MKLGKEDKGKPCLEKPSPDTNWFIWDGIRGTRANQDYQRELEDTSLLDIENHLAGRRQGKLVKVTSNDASSYNSGGSFLKLEQVGKGSSSGVQPACEWFLSVTGLAGFPLSLSTTQNCLE